MFRKIYVAGLGVCLLLLAGYAPAQWVMAGRAVAGRIQHMTQHSDAGGYDVATVVLEAPAERIYATALKTLQGTPDVKITKQDEKKGRIEFRKGKLVAGLNITALGEKVTELVVASSVSDQTPASATPLVVDRVLRVCQEMKVQCSVQGK